jgi:hypothetical protein
VGTTAAFAEPVTSLPSLSTLGAMSGEWDISDEEMDAWLEEWEAVDRAAADYLAEHLPGVADDVDEDEARWLDAVAETISASEEPDEGDVEAASAVMALQHADWLGLALGVARRGAGGTVDPEQVQADIDDLEDIEGEIEDLEGQLAVLTTALLHLTPRWQDLGVLDGDERLTPRGAWGLPRALYRNWRNDA